MIKYHNQRDDHRVIKPHHRDAPFIPPQYDGVLIVDDADDDVAEVLRESGVTDSVRDAYRSKQW